MRGMERGQYPGPGAARKNRRAVNLRPHLSSSGHNGKGVQNVAEGKPAKWKLKEAAD
jgi:hypothetical protein